MKEMPPIPKCQNPACQCDLYPERRRHYDMRRKYCKDCAEERKRNGDDERMKTKREQARNERTRRIEELERENKLLREQHEHDVMVNLELQNRLAQLRDWR